MHPNFFEYRIENTNACGYRCVMCPREKQTRKIGFMPLHDFELLLGKLPQTKALIHVHGYGEALLDETLHLKIALINNRKIFDSFIITTLGVEKTETELASLVDSGLQNMMISFYGFTNETYKEVHKVDKLDLVKKNLRLLSKLCSDKKSSLRRVIKIQSPDFKQSLIKIGQKDTEKQAREDFIKEMTELDYKIQMTGAWHNYGDGRSYNSSNDKTCPVIIGNRSRILNITWDLNVIPCCFDFNSTIKFGNLKTQTLEEIFQSKAYNDFVLAHLRNDLSAYPVCQNCEKTDYNR